MIEFSSHPECDACTLHELSENPGIPTRPADFQPADRSHSRALLVIGQNPGVSEDKLGKSWCGWAGTFVHGILKDFIAVEDYADVFLANAARCRTPHDDAPSVSACKHCAPWLREDLELLVSEYGGSNNVWILALGAPAVKLCSGLSVKKAVATQGAPRVLACWQDGPAFKCFYSFHPAATRPGRNPSYLDPMDAHFRFLKAALSGRAPDIELPNPPMAAVSRLDTIDGLPPSRVGLDIETYGCLSGYEQTVFQPHKMVAIDGIPKAKIIVCACLGWHNGKELITSTYRWSSAADRLAFRSALATLPPTTTLVGTNIGFDICTLRFVDINLACLLRLDRFMLDDTIVTNHLDSDVRPERSLKAVSRLLYTMDYDGLAINLAAGLQATSETDPNLLLYNAADVVASLKTIAKHEANIEAKHGGSHPALTAFGRQFRSDLLWIAVHQQEVGITFDRAKLEWIHARLSADCEDLAEAAYSRGIVIKGKGSATSLRNLILTAAEEADILDDERLVVTKVRKDVSTGRDNLQLLLATLPLDAERRQDITTLEDYRSKSKIVDTYTAKLLGETRAALVGDTAYPTWFVVPSYSKDTTDSEGGTRQGRFSAKDPPAQTLPPTIERCLLSRYGHDGVLAAYDMSQQELRTAALFFGDPALIAAYQRGDDNHWLTAKEIWPGLSKVNSDYNEKREIGKRVNFLMLYLGGWHKLIETVRKYLGVELTELQAKNIIAGYDRRCRVLRQQQHVLLERTAADGFILLPTGWKRTFLGGREGALETYASEIANMPIQTLAAQAVQSSQVMILRERQAACLTFVMPAQIHDSVLVDSHKICFKQVDALVRYWLLNSPLWKKLEEIYGHHVPLGVERKIMYVGGSVNRRILEEQEPASCLASGT